MIARGISLSVLAVALVLVSADGLAKEVDDARLRAADSDDESWLTHGRTYAEQRYSPLDQINETNVENLVPVWSFETGLKRGHEATPIVVDGVLYITGSWSHVFAIDARTGQQIWHYDPRVDPLEGRKTCCDVVNRGVAFYRGRVYVGILDGRLEALDAKTGKVVWSVVTVDPSKPYTITGAPRIVKGFVIIGNGGAELGVRGYVSAYAADTGKRVWRTFTVPGDPSKPFESKAMEEAAKTWSGGEWWKAGGGGTAWDAITYDPELDFLYVGTGNGSPWTRYARSPGGGDNLYLSSILALRPDTGELVWHYQTTPGDNWDFTATQPLILADLTIEGKPRKVIMQAPKNGFFYVIDRTDGEFISAAPYVKVTWASMDQKTGRPLENQTGDYPDGVALVQPTAFGGHNWHPMSFNPKTGLVYIPANEIMGAYRRAPAFEYKGDPQKWNTGTDFNVYGMMTRGSVSGRLVAWDPIQQKAAWSHFYANPWNGGTLTTGGNLVFQGATDGRYIAYRASDGKQLWEEQTGSAIIAGGVTYLLDGKQYVTVLAGWGGVFALASGQAGEGLGGDGKGRLISYALPGTPPTPTGVLEMITKQDELSLGERLYHENCVVCHGGSAIAMGAMPDLRYSTPEVKSVFADIVLRGSFRGKGMPSFEKFLSEADVRKIQTYLAQRAKDSPPTRR